MDYQTPQSNYSSGTEQSSSLYVSQSVQEAYASSAPREGVSGKYCCGKGCGSGCVLNQ